MSKHERVGILPSSKIFYNSGSNVVTFTLFTNMMGATKRCGHVCHRSSPGTIVSKMVGRLFDTCYQFTGFQNKCYLILVIEWRAGNIFAWHFQSMNIFPCICLLKFHCLGSESYDISKVFPQAEKKIFRLFLWRLFWSSRASVSLAVWFMWVPRWPDSLVSGRAVSR